MKNLYDFDQEVAKVQSWAFTIKKLGDKHVQPSDYDYIISTYNRFGKVTDHVYEKDPSGIWHVHGIVEIKKTQFRKKFCLHGFHVKLKEIYDYLGWIEYMAKPEGKQDNPPKETLQTLLGDEVPGIKS